MRDILVLIISYFAGAIPFGVIIARRYYNVDIRTLGSGNPGATNVWRSLGRKPGMATLALDALKGAFGVVLARLLVPGELGVQVLCGALAIIGHNWSVFLKGRGGKGVATSAGVFLALMPFPTLIAIAVFAAVLRRTGHVSMGSMAAAGALLISSFLIHTPWIFRFLVVIAAAMVLFKHVPNMKRLAKGEEPKVTFK